MLIDADAPAHARPSSERAGGYSLTNAAGRAFWPQLISYKHATPDGVGNVSAKVRRRESATQVKVHSRL